MIKELIRDHLDLGPILLGALRPIDELTRCPIRPLINELIREDLALGPGLLGRDVPLHRPERPAARVALPLPRPDQAVDRLPAGPRVDAGQLLRRGDGLLRPLYSPSI